MTTILSVDPGLTGAMAVLQYVPQGKQGEGASANLLVVEDLPTAEAKQNGKLKTHLMMGALASRMKYFQAFYGVDQLVIEEVNAMPGQGVVSMFRFGYTAGAIAGVAAGLEIPTLTVRPQVWTKIAGVRQGDDAGRLRVNQLFPAHVQNFTRKKDHNRADAVLIGYAHLCEVMGQKLLTK